LLRLYNLKAPVTWVILNNNSLGWVKYEQKVLGERYIAVDFEVQPDFVEMAHAYHCYGKKVVTPTELTTSLVEAMKANEQGTSAILEILIDQDEFPEGFLLILQFG